MQKQRKNSKNKHYLYNTKKKEQEDIDFEIPNMMYKRGLKYLLVDKYPHYWLYVHYYETKGCFYECFDLHDLKCVDRYGDC